MRIPLITLAALAVLGAPAMAHPDHDIDEPEDVNPEQAARSAVVRLITQAKLNVSWSKSTIVDKKERRVKGTLQSVFTFRNPTERDKAKQTLYVVLNGNGALISADHVLK
jgi:hypothetical protein